MELRDQTLDSFWQRPGRSAAGYRPIGAAAACQLTANFGVEVNILRAQIDRLNITSYGFLLIQVARGAVSVEQSIASLMERGIGISRLSPEVQT
jgi:ABC-type methionine transport system ATPase subunit